MMLAGLLLSVAIATTLVNAAPLTYSQGDAVKQFFVDLIFESLREQSSQPEGDIAKVVKGDDNKMENTQSKEEQQSEDTSEENSNTSTMKDNETDDESKTGEVVSSSDHDTDQKQLNKKQNISELHNTNEQVEMKSTNEQVEMKSENVPGLPWGTLEQLQSILEHVVELQRQRERERSQQQQEHEIDELLMELKARQGALKQREEESFVYTHTRPVVFEVIRKLKSMLERVQLQLQREKESVQQQLKSRKQEILDMLEKLKERQEATQQQREHSRPQPKKAEIDSLMNINSRELDEDMPRM